LLIGIESYRFVFPIQIGNPSQNLHVIFDTGSGDFWVWSWLMGSAALGTHPNYNATASTTAKKFENQSFSSSYASGNTYGEVWSDDVTVSGKEANIVVTENPIECATNVGELLDLSLP
jgi:hypothetical protein